MANDSMRDPLCLDNQICFSLYSATNAMVRAYRPLLEKLDLTYSQYLAMMVLWQSDGISVKDMGEQLHLDSGTLTPLLKRLETKGLVIRGRSEHDERVRVLNITAAARVLKLEAEKVPEQMKCQIQISEAKLMQLKSLCDEVYSNLTE
ncbi:MarR family winged helix-turn-helix transcriptional regulator [Shewanella kaireitica]|uniref:MarR family winged helix-turn-helix transcriptional regulator n=1 Tax=Shewanella kaireitica TaxID=212021 RepID=UPI00200DE177|nr:MarR family transcriptional regulator [Shewanella kaireitica]MCL1092311.1 MarR family transcriptional regulator [Shewanella kaireitica]